MNEEQIKQWKERYNEYLLRHCKAIIYLDDNKINFADREKWIPKYQEILKELDYILSLFDSEGIKYTNDEALGGFNVDNN